MIIDTHCHLDDDKFNLDLREVIAAANRANVGYIVIPGANIVDLPKAAKIAHESENIYFAIGVHPDEIKGYDEDILNSYANDEKCVAVGECGLDYFRLPETGVDEYKNAQKACFKAQIRLAIRLKKPLIVHTRDANEDTFEILREFKSELVGGIIHCYNASPLLLELSDKFCYGIGGVLTFKNAKRLVEILPRIPLERLVIETDAPYLTPEPFRGQRNEPRFTNLVVEKISEILGLEKSEIEEITTKNARNLYKI